MPVEHRNQIHPPSPKKVRVDAVGNDRRKLWLKDNTTTMLLTQGLTENACKAVINRINTALIELGVKPLPQSRFLITR